MPGRVPPAIGLALSGGAVRGIAHIAVLEVLEQEGIPIHAIAGTSAGSIVGALYAAGMPLSEIKRILLTAKWKDLLKLTIPKKGLISSEGIYRFMDEILPVKKFSGLQIPYAAVATDLHTGEKVSIMSGSVAKAVQASCSLPVIFTPTEINRKSMVDGGVSSQIPVRTAREELGAKYVIAVNVNYKAIELDQYDTIIKIAAHLSALWASRNARAEEKLADVVIPVNAKGIALYDLSKSRELLRRGRKAAEEKLPEMKALIGTI
ncbi:MAG TPA: patatin-like phospholipase family protein [Nitrospirota bacterium]|nr:patatin-like phospholipase family protein [Nitrospirota bacterium]